ncbi:MAG: hypothetical protein H0W08_13770, partial [Acidobacteria bacterium]|nr:hypothetical protein [Acidobacteriota bacterium]
MGAALLWVPFYAAADVWTRVTGVADANGFTQPYVNAVAYGSAFYGFFAILLSIRAARLLVPGKGAFSAGLAVWAGTPLLFYMYVAPPFSHACSAFAVALLVTVWLRVRDTWSPRGVIALGLSAALVAMVREQDAFVVVGPVIDFVWRCRSAFLTARGTPPLVAFAQRRASAALHSDASLRPLALAGLAGVISTAVGYTPQLLAYNALNGYAGPAEHVSRKMYWYAPHGLQVLASPHHGFFFWTPLAVLAIAGLFLLKDRLMAACLLIMAASQVYVAG